MLQEKTYARPKLVNKCVIAIAEKKHRNKKKASCQQLNIRTWRSPKSKYSVGETEEKKVLYKDIHHKN